MSVIYFYKTAGAILIVLSCAYISAEYTRTVRRSLDAARDAERLILYIAESILYRAAVIPIILASYDGAPPVTKEIWKRAAETSLYDAVSNTDTPFDAKTRLMLTEFATELGRGYREPQAELCRRTAARLHEHIAELDASKSDRLRVALSICVFLCLSLLILLV